MGLFRKVAFQCGGCGKTMEAKATVKPEQVADPLAPPPGWFRLDVTAQHPATGAIGGLSVFTCTEACAQTVAKGGGVCQGYIGRFKTVFAPVSLTPREEGPAMGPDGPDEQTNP